MKLAHFFYDQWPTICHISRRLNPVYIIIFNSMTPSSHVIISAQRFIGKSTHSFSKSLFIHRGRLTVDGDVYSLHICVDVIDSCALVRARSLPADRWDFQVLIIWCHVPYERSHTESGRKWRWSFRANAASQQLWPPCSFPERVAAQASQKVSGLTLMWRKRRRVSLILILVRGGNSSTYADPCLLLRCDAEQRIQRIYFRHEQNKDRSVTQKWKTPEWQERRILLSLAATRSGTTGEICAASCVSKCARVDTVTRAQSCLWCSSVVSLKAYKAQFLSSLTYFRGRYDTLWLALC